MAASTACIAALLLALGAAGTAVADTGALRLSLNQRMGVVYTPRPNTPDLLAPQALARAQQRAALGLEFASPSKNEGPRSLLRVQLSGDSALNFRPRGGGLSVTYRSKF